MKWHNATEIPSPDIEVIAEVEGFKYARFCVLRHTEEGWWQHIPKVFDRMPCDGWVGTGNVRVIRWRYIEED